MAKSLLFLLPSILVIGACQPSHKRELSKRPVINKQARPPQTLDECPAAEGIWSVGNSDITIGRKEGFLTIQNPDLSETVVMDGVARKIKQNSTQISPQITATCRGRIINLTYKYEGKTVTQAWNIDLEKDLLVITEKDGVETKTLHGARLYSPLTKPE